MDMSSEVYLYYRCISDGSGSTCKSGWRKSGLYTLSTTHSIGIAS